MKQSDVVVENMGPGVMDRLGIGYEALRRLNPRVISASVKGFASGGPYENYKSFEWIAPAMAGAAAMTGSPDGPPTKAIGGLAVRRARASTAIGILALSSSVRSPAWASSSGSAAGCGRQSPAHSSPRDLRLGQARPAPGESLGGGRAVQHLPLPSRWAERLRVHPLRHRGDVEDPHAHRGTSRAGRGPALRRPA